MTTHIINLLVGFLALLYGFTIAILSIKNKPYNFYLFLLLTITGLARILETLGQLEVIEVFSPFRSIPAASFIYLAVFYLFLSKLLKNESVHYRDLLLIIAVIFISIVSRLLIDTSLAIYLFILLSSLLYLDLLKNTWSKYGYNKKSLNEKRHLNEIKPFYFLFMLQGLFVIFFSYLSILINDKNNLVNIFYAFSGYPWIFILIYLFFNPSLVIGNVYLSKLIKNSELKYDFDVWDFKSKKILNGDGELHEKIKLQIPKIIIKINEINPSTQLNNLEELSAIIRIPKLHLKLIFKYYCNYSVLDFFNLQKIVCSLALIEDGFLQNSTIESLSIKSGFSSRTTFHLNFKKFIGYNVSEYLKLQN